MGNNSKLVISQLSNRLQGSAVAQGNTWVRLEIARLGRVCRLHGAADSWNAHPNSDSDRFLANPVGINSNKCCRFMRFVWSEKCFELFHFVAQKLRLFSLISSYTFLILDWNLLASKMHLEIFPGHSNRNVIVGIICSKQKSFNIIALYFEWWFVCF